MVSSNLIRVVDAVLSAADWLGLEVAVPLSRVLKADRVTGDGASRWRFFLQNPFTTIKGVPISQGISIKLFICNLWISNYGQILIVIFSLERVAGNVFMKH